MRSQILLVAIVVVLFLTLPAYACLPKKTKRELLNTKDFVLKCHEPKTEVS